MLQTGWARRLSTGTLMAVRTARELDESSTRCTNRSRTPVVHFARRAPRRRTRGGCTARAPDADLYALHDDAAPKASTTPARCRAIRRDRGARRRSRNTAPTRTPNTRYATHITCASCWRSSSRPATRQSWAARSTCCCAHLHDDGRAGQGRRREVAGARGSWRVPRRLRADHRRAATTRARRGRSGPASEASNGADTRKATCRPPGRANASKSCVSRTTSECRSTTTSPSATSA